MKILYVTTIGSTMDFFIDHIKMLTSNGHVVELACSNLNEISEEYIKMNLKIHFIPFSRNPLDASNIKAMKVLDALVAKQGYDIVHCHTPNASVITRMVCNKYRKKGLKVFYTAHGFHFYKGAPIQNWMLFYPVEWLCSFKTDKLITINEEDYELAKKKFHMKELVYIPGVGFNYDKFDKVKINVKAKREELGVTLDDIVVLSVGELNDNKNQEVVLRALKDLPSNVYYFIAGCGPNADELNALSETLGVSNRFKLLGQRQDVPELYKASDIFAHASFREGLPVSVMEAMAAGLPIVASTCRGVSDLIEDRVNGFICDPRNSNEFKDGILKLIQDKKLRESIGDVNRKVVKRFSTGAILDRIKELYL